VFFIESVKQTKLLTSLEKEIIVVCFRQYISTEELFLLCFLSDVTSVKIYRTKTFTINLQMEAPGFYQYKWIRPRPVCGSRHLSRPVFYTMFYGNH